MNDATKSKVTQATMFPILGILLAGIVGVIAIPEVLKATFAGDLLMASAFMLLIVAAIFGTGNIIAARRLVVASREPSSVTGQPLQQITGVKVFVFVMHIVWLVINASFWLVMASAYNLSHAANNMYGSSGDFLNPLTMVPLVILAGYIIAQQLVMLELRSQTNTAPKPVWQPPVAPAAPAAPVAPAADKVAE